MQARFSAKKRRYEVNACTNYDTKTEEINEVDLATNIALLTHVKNTWASFYGGLWMFPDGSSPLRRVGLSVGIKNLPLNLSLSVGQNLGPVFERGQLFTGGIGKNVSLGEKVNVSLGTGISYNNGYFSERTGLSHVTRVASLGYRITDKISALVAVNNQRPIKDFKEDIQKETWANLGVNINF